MIMIAATTTAIGAVLLTIPVTAPLLANPRHQAGGDLAAI
jgi:hypothetical protein